MVASTIYGVTISVHCWRSNTISSITIKVRTPNIERGPVLLIEQVKIIIILFPRLIIIITWFSPKELKAFYKIDWFMNIKIKITSVVKIVL